MKRRSPRIAVWVALEAGALTFAGRATAEPVRLEAALGSSCGGDLDERLAARGVAVAASAPSVATITVLERTGSLEGSLVLRRASGTTTRSITATTCDEILDALAFTLALALEGEATPTSAPAERPGPSDTAPPSFELAAGIGGGVATLVAPSVGGVLTAWELVGARRGSWLSPSLVVGGVIALPVLARSSGERATAALQGGMADLCPARFARGAFALRPCARVSLGRSQVRSEGFIGARLDERLYGIVGVAVRGEATIAGPVFAQADLAVGAPLVRATYVVGGARLFETPGLSLGGSLGAGVHFW